MGLREVQSGCEEFTGSSSRVDLAGGTATFTFSDPDQRADSVMREFYNGGQVATSEYAGAQKCVRDLMWEARRQG